MSGILLDTHVFIWLSSGEGQLSDETSDIISDRSQQVYLSIVSIWEIGIKLGLGKLEIDTSMEELVGYRLQRAGIKLLELTSEDALAYSRLGFPNPNHRDPFDRMLIVQARSRDLQIVTRDSAFVDYGIRTVKA